MQTQNLVTIIANYTVFPTALLNTIPASKAQDHFILYGASLNLTKLRKFQAKCEENFILLDSWNITYNTVVLLQGHWQPQWLEYAHQLELDIAWLNFNASLQLGGLLVMDMDSTAIEIECIDEIAKLAGTGELVSEITERAMLGELDFEQSLRRRVSTLKGSPEIILQQVRKNLPLMPGLQETLKSLQQHGWRTAIVSGGFTYFTNHLKALLKLDYTVSNQLEIIDGILTGSIKGEVIDAEYKAKTLQQLAQQFNIPLENTVAVGDGANDLAMLSMANLGIAFHAKPKVQQQAQIVVNFADLTALLCILSANDRITKNRSS